ncbi:restriction endonuclease [Bacillus sp. S/N-304-OC-R1]|uniref:nSTAND3 domain-containing NTPase n=1 Tax=Bacillus sp. S/N-304-OC-R1 TaxID=2758034 RepID=UPI001C8D6589|nr:restriction endonuclease [Bacillus sp. S/N-304-OC-R1]MBY0120918.1 restriction endonuclease [Bacillus sp. S/N-304-OC-R1]
MSYDLSVLAPDEFELLCKDLYESENNIKLENFKNGRDGGIDLRYTIPRGKKKVIIQCKRSSDYNNLIKNLKKDVDKVKKLNPSKYIVMTSAGLSPLNKDEIIKMFSGYIKSTSDIIGGDEIQRQIIKHTDVERRHYKLWIGSTNILQTIVNNNILNRSSFTATQIQQRIKYFVQNDSFKIAKEILKNNGFLILSGNPGVGKTTLADMLSFNYIASGYSFYEISENIEEAEKVFENDKKQIFYYDDFLGRNFLERSLTKNEDRRLLNFIDKITSMNNKKFILTTREYILRQAQMKYDLLNDSKIDLNKHIVNVEKYNKYIKAKILYNHLFFSSVPQEYLENIKHLKNYKRIINHKNYNPRLINLMTNSILIDNVSSDKYADEFIRKLDYPDEIWQEAFENTIRDYSQWILYVLLVMGERVEKSELESGFNNLNLLLNNKFGNRDFKKGLRELEKTFIKINIINNNFPGISKGTYISFQNPSIKDFLIKYISHENYIVNMLWKSVPNAVPLIHSFSTDNVNEKKIPLDSTIINDVLNVFCERFNSFSDCGSERQKIWVIKNVSEVFIVDNFHQLKNLIIQEMKNIEQNNNIYNSEFLHLLHKFKSFLDKHLDYKEILLRVINSTGDYTDLELIFYMQEKFYDLFSTISSEFDVEGTILKVIESDMENVIEDEFEGLDEEDLRQRIDLYENVKSLFKIDIDEHLDLLEDTLSDISESQLNDDYDGYDEDPNDFMDDYYSYKEDSEIDSLFDSLE